MCIRERRMSSRWNQLERGQSSMETKRKHIPTWLYKLGGRLDKQYAEIVSALSDINAFNAGKKRDKALDLLSAWLPDVEKFSKEIGKQQALSLIHIFSVGGCKSQHYRYARPYGFFGGSIPFFSRIRRSSIISFCKGWHTGTDPYTVSCLSLIHI